MRNFTPHVIKIIDVNSVKFDPKIRKYIPNTDCDPIIIAEFSSSGMLSAKMETVAGKPIGNIPIFEKKVVGCDPLPDGEDKLIVSAIFAVTVKQLGLSTDRLLIVADPVVTPDGNQILGCIGLGPAL